MTIGERLIPRRRRESHTASYCSLPQEDCKKATSFGAILAAGRRRLGLWTIHPSLVNQEDVEMAAGRGEPAPLRRVHFNWFSPRPRSPKLRKIKKSFMEIIKLF